MMVMMQETTVSDMENKIDSYSRRMHNSVNRNIVVGRS